MESIDVFSPTVDQGVNAFPGATTAKKAPALKKLVNAIVGALKERIRLEVNKVVSYLVDFLL